MGQDPFILVGSHLGSTTCGLNLIRFMEDVVVGLGGWADELMSEWFNCVFSDFGSRPTLIWCGSDACRADMLHACLG